MANILSIGQGFPTSVLRYQFAPATGKTLVAGDVVEQTDAFTVDYATFADGEDKSAYVIIEGNDTFSGKQTQKVVCAAGNFSYLTTNYETGSYTVNSALTANAGKITLKTGTKKTLGYVMSFSLTQGLKVKWDG
jgi:hypothetical protein